MTTMMIANNCTRENGQFCGDQLCYLKIAYLMVQNQPDVDKVIMGMSHANEMSFLWDKFICDPKGDSSLPPVEVVYDELNPGDNPARWAMWDRWRWSRMIEEVRPFDHYRELYLRIHGSIRQHALCGGERGLGRRNIYEYVYYGQDNKPDGPCKGSDWFDDTLIDHPKLEPTRDVYISPHAKTQGNLVFTFDFWSDVVRHLIDSNVTVTVGYNSGFCEDLSGHHLYKKHWGDHYQWMEEICRHKLVACGNTGTGWLAAACGVPMITMEPHNSVMADHRYRECGLKNIVEVVDGHKLDEMNNDMSRVAEYVAKRIVEQVRHRVVMTTGCYDILHAGHIRHLERSRTLGTKLIVALNSDSSVRALKGRPSISSTLRPINPMSQRKSVLEALRCVDEVQVFDGPNALPLIERIRPDVLTNGFGYTLDQVVGRSLVESYGGKVVITCTDDARDEPSTTKIADKIAKRTHESSIADLCREGARHGCNPYEKMRLMADEFLSVKDLPGDVADLGSYKGGCAFVLRKLAPEKCLHLFDTWSGTPYDDPMCHHKTGEWATSLEGCKALVGTDVQTYYHQGVFGWDDPDYEISDFCFVYVDMDTYQATIDALRFFFQRLVKGGKIVVDDYGWEPCAGVKKAVDEYFGAPLDECGHYKDTVSITRLVKYLYTCIIERR